MLLARKMQRSELPPCFWNSSNGSSPSKAPSAGLWAGQTDEAEMGFSYSDLERYLTDGPDAVAPALAMRIERLIRATEHKRVQAIMPERLKL